MTRVYYLGWLTTSSSLRGASCWFPSRPQALIHRTATIGWLTFPCQGKEAIHYSFLVWLHSLIAAEGLRCASLPFTESMSPKSIFHCKNSILTVLILERAPFHFTCGEYRLHCCILSIRPRFQALANVRKSSGSRQINWLSEHRDTFRPYIEN